jgi:chemotaxis protein MotB
MIVAVGLLTSCVVSKKKYDDLATKKSYLELDKAELQELVDSLSAANSDCADEVLGMEEELSGLITDTAKLGQLYKELISQYTDLSQISDADAQNLSAQLQKVGKLMQELEEKDRALAQDQNKIDRLTTSLDERERKLKDLETKIQEKDQATELLRKKVTAALNSFKQAGDLSVEMKDGKVYVSMNEGLVFKSGSYVVDEKGKTALESLANVIKEQKDLTIYVEGHTDNVAYNGRGVLKDNWDLSVMRSTNILKYLINRGVDPTHIIASGRGEHNPKVENTDSASRSKNRRIEIIISPDLQELYKAIDSID